jgi:hypothetical protein
MSPSILNNNLISRSLLFSFTREGLSVMCLKGRRIETITETGAAELFVLLYGN